MKYNKKGYPILEIPIFLEQSMILFDFYHLGKLQ